MTTKAPMSRRAFFLGLGSGAASVALVWGVSRSQLWSRPIDGYPLPDCCSYVEYAGWILTKADKDRLTGADSIHLSQATTFEGHDLATQVVPNLEACSAWCLSEPECQGFTFGKPEHPDPAMRNRCWLKGTSQLTPVPDPRFTSGVRR